MDAWVFLFSKFTDELIFLEGIGIFSILGMYAAYYILKRRKYGVAEKVIPSEVIRLYLSELTGDAENLRNELFGLLGSDTMEDPLAETTSSALSTAELQAAVSSDNPPAAPLSNAAIDQQILVKMKELEKKLSEQAKALETLLNEKMKLEEELAQANAQLKNSGGVPAAGASVTGSQQELLQKIQKLEAQLNEYAVIEEDLANLKKLQKENKSLRVQLEEINLAKGVSTAETPAAATAEAAAPTVPAPAPEPAKTEPTPAPETTAAPAVAAATTPPAEFEKKVDEVEKQIAATAAPAPTPTPTAPATTPAAQLPPEQSEAKLAEDFDKLIQSSGS